MNAAGNGRHRAESAPKPPRHRSEDPADPANTGPLQVVNHLEHAHVAVSSGRRTAAAVATGGLLLTTGLTGTAAAPGTESTPATGANKIVTDTEIMRMVQADPAALVPYSKVTVTTAAAPPPPPPKPVAKAPVFTHKPAQVKPAPAPVVRQAPAPVQAPPATKGALIAAAALAQLGQGQDCTRLATRALAAVGINYHGWPAGYLNLGPQVSAAAARPGDLIYYANGGMGVAHIAVYIGGGMAVHGGWNGGAVRNGAGTTVKFSANVGSGPVFIRVL